MNLSTSLLLFAVAAAVLPMAAMGLRAPAAWADFEKLLVTGVVVGIVGTLVVHGFHGLDFFGLVHLVYLLAVVSLPILLIGWWVLGRFRGDRRQILTLSLVVGLLIAGGGAYATHVEPRLLRVDHVTVTAAVPAPIRVGVIADLQSPQVGRHEEAAISRMLEQSPDLVLVPGDWFQGTTEQLEASRDDFTSLLATLVARVGVVAVVSGDSDGADRLAPMVTDAGALFLDSTTTTVRAGGVDVRIAGVPVHPTQERFDTLFRLGEPTDALTILLAHRPDVVFELDPGADVDLIVAGHTHGGQVSVPFLGPPITFSDIPRDLAAGGLGVVDGFPLYVSTGVGLERLQAPQVRFGARPSIGIIDIVPG